MACMLIILGNFLILHHVLFQSIEEPDRWIMIDGVPDKHEGRKVHYLMLRCSAFATVIWSA